MAAADAESTEMLIIRIIEISFFIFIYQLQNALVFLCVEGPAAIAARRYAKEYWKSGKMRKSTANLSRI